MNKRFAISLLFEKVEHYPDKTTTTREMRVYVQEGITHNDALETAILGAFASLKGYSLSLYSIQEIPDQEAGEDR